MATRTAAVGLWVAALFTAYAVTLARIPDLGVVQSYAGKLDRELKEYVETVTGIESLTRAYDNHADDVVFKDVDGEALAADLASKLSKMLGKKMAALEKSVEWAEEIAANYVWNPDLELEDVNYVHAKRINESDPDFEFSEAFQQKVSFENSSVHIPVEIYEGDIEILNGLAWTNDLDTQWRKNVEDDEGLLWQYFGSQTGIMRNFPASKWRGTGVDLYDVRRRPWYTQGASSPKDMLILVDTSGSTHGQALALMKQSVRSLLDTLGENDFVNVARFSADASWIGCFETFVQANYRNKMKLIDSVDEITAEGMASYTKGLEFAFEEFLKFENNENRTEGEGADCNKIIMFLTDGGTEMPEELFQKYNWPEKRIRIFGYAVGPTANPIAAVKWIACSNRGYFYKIPAMGAIRSQVQDYYKYLSDGLVANQSQASSWTRLYDDNWGLGMMTTVTLPVYNRTQESTNQTILGVMGSDVTVSEMEQFIPQRQLGPNGYAFAINSNGYIVFHPNLKAKFGWLTNPPNVDFLEVEFETEAKSDLRTEMIDGVTSSQTISTWVNVPDERHIHTQTRIYYYTPIEGSSFSLAIVLPQYAKVSIDGISPSSSIRVEDFTQLEDETLLFADWKYCANVEPLSNISTSKEDLLYQLQNAFKDCDKKLVDHLMFDAFVTKRMLGEWQAKNKTEYKDGTMAGYGVASTFVSTNGGLTRVYPASEVDGYDNDAHKNTWDAWFYQRSMDNDLWIYSAPYVSKPVTDPNATEPVITATKAIQLTNPIYKPAVVGVQLTQERLRQTLMLWVPDCKKDDTTCYLLDDGGYLLLSNDVDDNLKIGRYFGHVEPVLWKQMVNKSSFIMREQYDFQGACPTTIEFLSAGVKIVPPIFFEMLTLNWWATKIAWAYVNVNLWNWLFPSPEHYAYAQEDEILSNYSCIKHLAQYHRNPDMDKSEFKDYIKCGNCTRTLATSRMGRSNLVLVMVENDCGGECDRDPLAQEPEETPDPNFDDGNCHITKRYRKRPECFDYNENENDSECGSGTILHPSWTLLALHLVSLFVMLRLCRS